MRTLMLLSLLAVMTTAKALTPPKQYICAPDQLGNCICRQNETNLFPKTVKPLFLCDKEPFLILHGDIVQINAATGQTSVSYTFNGDRQMMSVESSKLLLPVINRYWGKEGNTWGCQDAALCNVQPRSHQ